MSCFLFFIFCGLCVGCVVFDSVVRRGLSVGNKNGDCQRRRRDIQAQWNGITANRHLEGAKNREGK